MDTWYVRLGFIKDLGTSVEVDVFTWLAKDGRMNLFALYNISSFKRWTLKKVRALDTLNVKTRLTAPLSPRMWSSAVEVKDQKHKGDQTTSAHCASQRDHSRSEKAGEPFLNPVTCERFYSEGPLMYTKTPLADSSLFLVQCWKEGFNVSFGD